ncbi:HGT1, partial [Symbiodinium sp. KB8]
VLGDRDVDLTLKRAQRSVTLTSAVSQVAYVAGLVVMAPAWGEILRASFQKSLDQDRELRSIRQELMPQASEDLLLRAESLGWQLHQDVHRYSVAELISWFSTWRSVSREDLEMMLQAVHSAAAGFWWPGRPRKVYIEERDVVLAEALKRLSGEVAVGIVGLAHLPGIRRNWTRNTSEDLEKAFAVPPRWLLPQAVSCGLLAGLPYFVRTRGLPYRRSLCGLSVILSTSVLGSSGWYSFFS